MVYTPNFSVKPAFVRVFVLLARIVGVFWLIGGVLFALSAVVVATGKLLNAACAALLIACGLGLTLAKGPSVADLERWRQRMGFSEPDEQ